MPNGINAFNSILARARDVASPSQATVTVDEARSAVYAVVREHDAADTALAKSQVRALVSAGGFTKTAAKTLQAFADGTSTTTDTLRAWAAHGNRADGDGGVKVTVEEAKDVLRLISSFGLNPTDTQAAIDFVRPSMTATTFKAAQAALAQAPTAVSVPDPTPSSRPVDLTRFNALLTAFRQDTSEYGKNLNLGEALALIYVLAADVAPVDAAAAVAAAQRVLAEGNVGPKATPALAEFAKEPKVGSTRLFELWLAHATRKDGVAIAAIDESQLKDGLAIMSASDVPANSRASLLASLQAARLTAAADRMLQAILTPPPEPQPSLPDVSPSFAESLCRFKACIAAARDPGSDYAENLNLAEANAALFELAYGLKAADVPAAQAAVRAVLAAGKVGSKAGPVMEKFVAQPLVDSLTLFDYWMDSSRSAQSASGATIHTAEMSVGLSILADPSLSKAAYLANLTRLRGLTLSDGAKALLDACLGSTPVDPSVPVTQPTVEATSVLVGKVFAGFAAIHPEFSGEALLEAFYRHAYTRHSARSDAEILARLQAEPGINGSGAFTSRDVASKVIADVVGQKAEQVAAWMKKAPVSSMIVLRYLGTAAIGRGLERGEAAITDKTNARIVLQKVADGVYRVITAFPED